MKLKIGKLSSVLLAVVFLTVSCGVNNENASGNNNENKTDKNGGNIITAEYKAGTDLKVSEVAVNYNKKVLIVYFSLSGNTKTVANDIQKITGGDIFEITTVNPYPSEYRTVTEIAQKELNSDYLPELKEKVKNISEYDTIILGYPLWWGHIPQAVKKFLLENNLSGKTIAPFCTHGGSGLSQSVNDIKKILPNSVITEGLAIRGANAKNSMSEVRAWLEKIKI